MIIRPGEPRPEIWIFGNSGHGGDKAQHRGLAPWSAPSLAPITVVIPSIPPRVHQLNRALKSIQVQTLQPTRVIVQVDHLGEGAAVTRNKGLQKVPADSEAVAFLDDDDYFGKYHLQLLWAAMVDNQADYTYGWFTVAGPGLDPFPQFFKKRWDPLKPHQTTITTLVRRELAQEVGFRPRTPGDGWPDATEEGYTFGEDYVFTLRCNQKGAKIVHVPERTWFLVWTGNSTQGQAKNWRVTEADEPRFWVSKRKEEN